MEDIFLVDKNFSEKKIIYEIFQKVSENKNLFTYIEYDTKPYFVVCRKNVENFPSSTYISDTETRFRDSFAGIIAKYIFCDKLRILEKHFHVFIGKNEDKSAVVSESTVANLIKFCKSRGWKFTFYIENADKT